MDYIKEQITEWLKEILAGGIESNLSGMFDTVNQKVGEISTQVGQTPQGWNGGIFSMIQNLSETVILPIAGLILAFVMTLELIQLITDKNNLNDVDTTDVENLLSAREALDSLFRRRYCLIILSLELSEMDGLALLQTLRMHHAIPILVLSKTDNTDEKVMAFENGADAFITKPLNLRECQATTEALIRRYTELGGDLEKPYARTVGGSLVIDPQYRSVTFDGILQIRRW